jgi:hypothetical protein
MHIGLANELIKFVLGSEDKRYSAAVENTDDITVSKRIWPEPTISPLRSKKKLIPTPVARC